MRAEILPTHTPALFAEAARRAAEALRLGELVVLPTETVYGLAANAFEPAAVGRIFEVKGRPSNNPIIVHVASQQMALACVREWPNAARTLACAFWPGPLTMVLRKSDRVPAAVTAGGDTVGIRWPQHPFMQAVINACGFPLAAPSANLSNQLSPTTARHAARQLGDKVALIVDGGSCHVGIESTVVDLVSEPLRVLRAGMISLEAIEETVGRDVSENLRQANSTPSLPGTLRSPGMLARHYAPRARLIILSWETEADLARELQKRGLLADRGHILAHSRIPDSGRFPHVNVVPHDPDAFARALYAELHRCDEEGAEWIVVEAPPQGPEWSAIHDRLRRGAADG